MCVVINRKLLSSKRELPQLWWRSPAFNSFPFACQSWGRTRQKLKGKTWELFFSLYRYVSLRSFKWSSPTNTNKTKQKTHFITLFPYIFYVSVVFSQIQNRKKTKKNLLAEKKVKDNCVWERPRLSIKHVGKNDDDCECKYETFLNNHCSPRFSKHFFPFSISPPKTRRRIDDKR